MRKQDKTTRQVDSYGLTDETNERTIVYKRKEKCWNGELNRIHHLNVIICETLTRCPGTKCTIGAKKQTEAKTCIIFFPNNSHLEYLLDWIG